MQRSLLTLFALLGALSAATAGPTGRKLSQLSTVVTLPAPIEEYPPGIGTGLLGGTLGGTIAGTQGAAAGAVAARQGTLYGIGLGPSPEGEVLEVLPVPDATLAGAVGAEVGGRRGARLGGALGAALTQEIYGTAPQGELVTVAPGVELPPVIAGALIGSTVGAAVGASTGAAGAAALVAGPGVERLPLAPAQEGM